MSPRRDERLYWVRYAEPSGADLAALRRGLGRPPGAVAQMLRYYAFLAADGRETDELRAEHTALTLFAVHQQGKSYSMHRPGIGLGTALLALRRAKKVSTEGLDARFAAAATAGSLTELTGHLRGLINQLRAVDVGGRRGHPLDYTRLMWELRDWQSGEQAAVRRKWGGQYFVFQHADTGADDNVSQGVQ